jgi:thiosulfate reductase cytochrome b subunit
MLKLLFYIFLGWLLYKLVFDFFIPVYRGTKQVRRQVRDMQDAMRQQHEQQQQQQAPPRPAEPIKRDKGDYIDFEEIKN